TALSVGSGLVWVGKKGIYLTSAVTGRDPTFEIFEQTSAGAPAPAEFFRLSAQFHERGSGLHF
ncbi:MAG: hypothetical protein WB610_17315, partial [Rhodomicrobium sp.]